MRRAAIIVIAALGAVVLTAGPAIAGGGGHGPAADCAGFTEGDSLMLRDMCFDGAAHFLPADQDLRVRNEGQQAHNYVATDEAFETDTLAPGEEETVPNPGPGVYKVWCTLHASADGQGMAGVLVVEDADGASAVGSSASVPGSGDAGQSGVTGNGFWPVLAAGAVAAVALGGAALVRVTRQARQARAAGTPSLRDTA